MHDLIIFLSLLALGYVFGRASERRHFRSIREREAELTDILACSGRLLPPGSDRAQVQLVGGSVVVSVDYFKRVVAGLRGLLGGRVTAYESLLERARREAIIRMKLEAKECGAQAVFNVKMETSAITKGNSEHIACVEVYAYGTAVSVAPG